MLRLNCSTTAPGGSAIDLLFGYTGRDWDAQAELQYNRARWYDPKIGQWLSEDPIGFEAGDANVRRYVGNGVTTRVDPSGLQEGNTYLNVPLSPTAVQTNNGAHVSPRVRLLPLPEDVEAAHLRQKAYLGRQIGYPPIALPFPQVITTVSLPIKMPDGSLLIPRIGTINARLSPNVNSPDVINLYGDNENEMYPDYSADPAEDLGRPNTRILPSNSVRHITIRNSPIHLNPINLNEITRILVPGGTITFSNSEPVVDLTVKLFENDDRIIDIQKPFSYPYGHAGKILDDPLFTVQCRSKR